MVSVLCLMDLYMMVYCDYVYLIGLGMDVCVLMVELYGCFIGCFKGKGGFMYFFDKLKNFMGGYGIVGVQIVMGMGVVFVEKYCGIDNVVFVFMGDGVVCQGVLYELFNMVMMWKLLVIYIIENNNYVMGIFVECMMNVIDFFKIGVFYEMFFQLVNGMLLEVVYDVVEEVVVCV